MKLFNMVLFCFSLVTAGLSAVAAQSLGADAKIEQIGPSLSHPWGISLMDDNTALITLRDGELIRMELDSGKVTQISNVPAVFARRQGGLLDVLAHKDTKGQLSVYICFSKPVSGGAVTALERAELKKNRLIKRQDLFQANDVSSRSVHFGCRIAIHNNHLYLSIGDRGQRDNAQDLSSHAGAVVRLHLDGLIPENNPNFKNGAPGLFTKGHRNPQGMAIHPLTGAIWVNEHGPKGGDEINILQAGANYGWPLASFGKEYFGGPIGDGLTSFPGTIDPVWHWTPSIAPSGMAFYNKQMFPELTGGLLVTSLKFRRLYHMQLQNNLPARQSVILDRRIGRIRDVEVAPDGAILLLSDEANGGLFKLSR